MNQEQQTVYLDYNHKDKIASRAVRDHLVAAGFKVVYDDDYLPEMGDIKSWIENNVRDSDFHVCLVSENSLRSAWVTFAMKLGMDAGKFVPLGLDNLFWRSDFVSEVGKSIQQKLAELEEERQERQRIGMADDDLRPETDRLQAQLRNLPSIVQHLKNTLVFDISGDRMETGMRNATERMKRTELPNIELENAKSPPRETKTATKKDAGDIPIEAEKNIPQGKNYLLTIALNEYQDPKIAQLRNCVNDARAVEKVLTENYGFENLLPGLEDEAASASGIEDALDFAAKTITPEDNLLLFFSGHGIFYPERRSGGWLTFDTVVRFNLERQKRYAGLIFNSNLLDLLRPIRSRHTVLISDSCFSGSILNTRKSVSQALYALPTRVALTSGLENQSVPDSVDGSEHSPFAKFLVEILKENAAAELSIVELRNRLREKLDKARQEQIPNYGELRIGEHNPEGEFYFFKKSKTNRREIAQPDPTIEKKTEKRPKTPKTKTKPAPQLAPAAEKIAAPEQKVRDLIAAGETEAALKLLAETKSEAVLLLSRFNNVERHYHLGLIDFEERERTLNQIRYAALNL